MEMDMDVDKDMDTDTDMDIDMDMDTDKDVITSSLSHRQANFEISFQSPIETALGPQLNTVVALNSAALYRTVALC